VAISVGVERVLRRDSGAFQRHQIRRGTRSWEYSRRIRPKSVLGRADHGVAPVHVEGGAMPRSCRDGSVHAAQSLLPAMSYTHALRPSRWRTKTPDGGAGPGTARTRSGFARDGASRATRRWTGSRPRWNLRRNFGPAELTIGTGSARGGGVRARRASRRGVDGRGAAGAEARDLARERCAVERAATCGGVKRVTFA
jgi:hypothetical protein